jgi:hypothetical protein
MSRWVSKHTQQLEIRQQVMPIMVWLLQILIRVTDESLIVLIILLVHWPIIPYHTLMSFLSYRAHADNANDNYRFLLLT